MSWWHNRPILARLMQENDGSGDDDEDDRGVFVGL